MAKSPSGVFYIHFYIVASVDLTQGHISMKNSRMSTQVIVQQIRTAAQLYKKHLVGKKFLYVFDCRYIEVTFKADSFKHLTGVESSLSAREFYRKAIQGQLFPQHVSFTAMHPYALCCKKMQHIHDIANLATTECFMLEEITTTSRTYRFGATDLQFTICLDRPTDAAGVPVNEVYIAESLRHGDSMDKSRDVYDVSYIFSKNNTDKEYDTLVFRDRDAAKEDLPAQVLQMMSGLLQQQVGV